MVRSGCGLLGMSLLLISMGCTDLVEFQRPLASGLSVLSAYDLSVEYTIDDVRNASSICATTQYILVATTDGIVLKYDFDTYQLLDSCSVGPASPSGYFEMEYSSYENTAYLVGAFGNIIELAPPDYGIKDIFSICEDPIDIETAKEIPFFYVAEPVDNRIYEVRAETNGVVRYCTLYSTPVCMTIDQDEDTILVGTAGTTELVSTAVPGIMYHRALDHIPQILAIETVPDDTTLCALFAGYQEDYIALVSRYFPLPGGGGVLTGSVPASGFQPSFMCIEDTGSMAFILRYEGDGSCTVVGYDCKNHTIEMETSLPGVPMDMIYAKGRLLILTI
jgi:hypothetical protein